MMDCYNRCLCATCVNNENCKHGCEMCEPLQACRFVITRSKCKDYKMSSAVMTAIALQGGDANANANGSS